LETKFKMLQANYADFQSVIKMCDTLLKELKFSVPTIKQIYDLAKSYGDPYSVIEAISSYGKLTQLNESIEALANTKHKLEAEIAQLNEKIAELRTILEGLDILFKNAIDNLSPDVKKI